jgi:hypothetical protein
VSSPDENPIPPPAPDPPQLTPEPVPGEAAPLTTGDLGDLVDRATAPWPVQASTGNLVDRLGRSFDPGLHLTKGDGTPAVNPRSGRLFCLPSSKQKATRPQATTAKNPTDPAVKILTGDELPAAGAETVKNLTPSAAAEPVAPPQSPAEASEAAQANAEILVDLWQLAATLLAGPKAAAFKVDDLTDQREDKRLLASGRRWLLATQRTNPAATGTAHTLVGLRYVGRAVVSDEGKKHFEGMVVKLRQLLGFPPPPITPHPDEVQS